MVRSNWLSARPVALPVSSSWPLHRVFLPNEENQMVQLRGTVNTSITNPWSSNSTTAAIHLISFSTSTSCAASTDSTIRTGHGAGAVCAVSAASRYPVTLLSHLTDIAHGFDPNQMDHPNSLLHPVQAVSTPGVHKGLLLQDRKLQHWVLGTNCFCAAVSSTMLILILVAFWRCSQLLRPISRRRARLPVPPASTSAISASVDGTKKYAASEENNTPTGVQNGTSAEKSHRKSTDLSRAADQLPRRSGPRGSRVSEKDEKNGAESLPSLADSSLWPDVKSAAVAVDDGKKKSQDKTLDQQPALPLFLRELTGPFNVRTQHIIILPVLGHTYLSTTPPVTEYFTSIVTPTAHSSNYAVGSILISAPRAFDRRPLPNSELRACCCHDNVIWKE